MVIDNYDSFTYNLVQYLGELGADVRVMRNDVVSVERRGGGEARADRDLAGAGPARSRPGVTMDVIRELGETTPILGVCLGHQAIGAVFGGAVVRAAVPMHGKTSTIEHDGRGVFQRDQRSVRRVALSLADRLRTTGCPASSRCRRGRARTARSWGCATGRGRSTACSFIPSRF